MKTQIVPAAWLSFVGLTAGDRFKQTAPVVENVLITYGR